MIEGLQEEAVARGLLNPDGSPTPKAGFIARLAKVPEEYRDQTRGLYERGLIDENFQPKREEVSQAIPEPEPQPEPVEAPPEPVLAKIHEFTERGRTKEIEMEPQEARVKIAATHEALGQVKKWLK